MATRIYVPKHMKTKPDCLIHKDGLFYEEKGTRVLQIDSNGNLALVDGFSEFRVRDGAWHIDLDTLLENGYHTIRIIPYDDFIRAEGVIYPTC